MEEVIAVKVEDIFSKLVKNPGGTITLELNSKTQSSLSPRTVKVRCLKTITSKQQVYLLVTLVDVMKSQLLSIGGGTKVIL